MAIDKDRRKLDNGRCLQACSRRLVGRMSFVPKCFEHSVGTLSRLRSNLAVYGSRRILLLLLSWLLRRRCWSGQRGDLWQRPMVLGARHRRPRRRWIVHAYSHGIVIVTRHARMGAGRPDAALEASDVDAFGVRMWEWKRLRSSPGPENRNANERRRDSRTSCQESLHCVFQVPTTILYMDAWTITDVRSLLAAARTRQRRALDHGSRHNHNLINSRAKPFNGLSDLRSNVLTQA